MTSNDTKTVSQAEFGRITGHSRQRVGQMVKAGQLTAINGRIHVPLGLAELERIRPRARHQPAASSQAATAAPASDDAPTYAVSRARREHAAAEREEMALQREAGNLLPADEVDAVVDDAAVTLRTALEALPVRLGARLVGHDEAAIEAILRDEIDRCLRELAARLRTIGQGGGNDDAH